MSVPIELGEVSVETRSLTRGNIWDGGLQIKVGNFCYPPLKHVDAEGDDFDADQQDPISC
jgi:hypothetical protein